MLHCPVPAVSYYCVSKLYACDPNNLLAGMLCPYILSIYYQPVRICEVIRYEYCKYKHFEILRLKGIKTFCLGAFRNF